MRVQQWRPLHIYAHMRMCALVCVCVCVRRRVFSTLTRRITELTLETLTTVFT